MSNVANFGRPILMPEVIRCKKSLSHVSLGKGVSPRLKISHNVTAYAQTSDSFENVSVDRALIESTNVKFKMQRKKYIIKLKAA